MFEIGEYVIYGSHGVCKIVSMEERVIDRKCVNYYVLEPQSQQGSRYMVPSENPVAMSKVRKILTREELDNLFQSDQFRQFQWITDENTRKQKYKELITGADRAALLGMIHVLHQHKKEQIEVGRKFHQCDENFLNDAQKLLREEFSLVLQINPDCVEQYVLDALGI